MARVKLQLVMMSVYVYCVIKAIHTLFRMYCHYNILYHHYNILYQNIITAKISREHT